ncbi:hypothetical protein [Paenibacillus chungangensis]|uniref:Helicase XPB/Ssl2 N-terminal domain-containing protein n=1 Tax=Paenibacillus chungangensis TaxID=696535 RepID=A0ABW3HN23_9BACL
MNLSDMLGYADIGQLTEIANAYSCECSSHSKNELIQAILSTMGRNDVFERQVHDMKLEDLRFLNSLLFDTRESYSLEDLMARVQQSRFGLEQKTEAEEADRAASKTKTRKSNRKKVAKQEPPSPREMILRFKHQGWLFNGFTGPGKYLFQVPNDLKGRFQEVMKRRLASQLHYMDEPPLYRDEQHLLGHDVKAMLHYVSQNHVQLSADGSMYKRYIQALLDRFSVQEKLPQKGAWRFGYGRHFNHYPNRLSFLYDYCYYSGYLRENHETLEVTTEGMERLSASPELEEESMYHYWLKLYRGSIPNLLSLVHWIHSLAEEWVTFLSIKEALEPFIKPYYYDNASSILEVRVLTMMMHLGLLRIGEHPQHGTVIRMTRWGHAVVSGKVATKQ